MALTAPELIAELELSKENEDVKTYLKGKAGELGIVPELNLDLVKSHIDSKKDDEEYKKFLGSMSDRRVTDALATYEAGTMKKKLEDQKKALTEEFERKGKESPVEKSNRDMRERMAKYEADSKKDKVSIFASTYATEKGIPIKLAMKVLNNIDFTGDDIDKIKDSAKVELDGVDELFAGIVKSRVAEELKKSSYTPAQSNSNSTTEWTDAKLKELYEEGKKSGKQKDIAKYSKAKREFEMQKKKQKK